MAKSKMQEAEIITKEFKKTELKQKVKSTVKK